MTFHFTRESTTSSKFMEITTKMKVKWKNTYVTIIIRNRTLNVLYLYLPDRILLLSYNVQEFTVKNLIII